VQESNSIEINKSVKQFLIKLINQKQSQKNL